MLHTNLFAQGVSMNTESIDMTERGWYASLSKQMHQSMYPFLVIDMEIPKHTWVWNIRLRMAFMAPVHARELDRVSNEEDWQIIEDEVLVAIFCEEAHCPASYISHGVA